MSINHVTISGNLTRDCELRSTSGGMSVLQFGVAVNDRRKNQQTGEWEDFPNFVDCTIFGKRAESLANYLPKGTKVAVEGKLRWSQWEDKQTGGKRSKLEVIADEIEFMSRQDGQQAGQPAQQPVYQQQPTYQVQPACQQPAMQPAPQGYAPQPTQPQYQPQQAQAYRQQPPAQQQTALYDEDIPF